MYLHQPSCFLESAKHFPPQDFCPGSLCFLCREGSSGDTCVGHSLSCLVSQHGLTSEMPSLVELPASRGLSLPCSSAVFPSWHINILCVHVRGQQRSCAFTRRGHQSTWGGGGIPPTLTAWSSRSKVDWRTKALQALAPWHWVQSHTTTRVLGFQACKARALTTEPSPQPVHHHF